MICDTRPNQTGAAVAGGGASIDAESAPGDPRLRVLEMLRVWLASPALPAILLSGGSAGADDDCQGGSGTHASHVNPENATRTRHDAKCHGWACVLHEIFCMWLAPRQAGGVSMCGSIADDAHLIALQLTHTLSAHLDLRPLLASRVSVPSVAASSVAGSSSVQPPPTTVLLIDALESAHCQTRMDPSLFDFVPAPGASSSSDDSAKAAQNGTAGDHEHEALCPIDAVSLLRASLLVALGDRPIAAHLENAEVTSSSVFEESTVDAAMESWSAQSQSLSSSSLPSNENETCSSFAGIPFPDEQQWRALLTPLLAQTFVATSTAIPSLLELGSSVVSSSASSDSSVGIRQALCAWSQRLEQLKGTGFSADFCLQAVIAADAAKSDRWWWSLRSAWFFLQRQSGGARSSSESAAYSHISTDQLASMAAQIFAVQTIAEAAESRAADAVDSMWGLDSVPGLAKSGSPYRSAKVDRGEAAESSSSTSQPLLWPLAWLNSSDATAGRIKDRNQTAVSQCASPGWLNRPSPSSAAFANSTAHWYSIALFDACDFDLGATARILCARAATFDSRALSFSVLSTSAASGLATGSGLYSVASSESALAILLEIIVRAELPAVHATLLHAHAPPVAALALRWWRVAGLFRTLDQHQFRDDDNVAASEDGQRTGANSESDRESGRDSGSDATSAWHRRLLLIAAPTLFGPDFVVYGTVWLLRRVALRLRRRNAERGDLATYLLEAPLPLDDDDGDDEDVNCNDHGGGSESGAGGHKRAAPFDTADADFMNRLCATYRPRFVRLIREKADAAAAPEDGN